MGIRSGTRQDGSDLPRIRPPHHLLGADASKAGDPCPGLPPPSSARLGSGSSTGYSQPPLKARLRVSKRPRMLRRSASGVAAARRPHRPRLQSVGLLGALGESREQVPGPTVAVKAERGRRYVGVPVVSVRRRSTPRLLACGRITTGKGNDRRPHPLCALLAGPVPRRLPGDQARADREANL